MITIVDVQFGEHDCFAEVDETTQCPICKHAIKPVFLDGHAVKTGDSEYRISIHYLCNACNNTFISLYESRWFSNPKFDDINLLYTAPIQFVPESFDKLIQDVSSDFVKIYNQALNSETLNLDEIAGIGYRKALEFLIKDFLIKKNPDKKDSIEKSQLGACINNFIDNPQLKTVASRAAWLGNDQTHYIQKFTDKDINDLKRLIRLTVHWISMILETEEAATIQPLK